LLIAIRVCLVGCKTLQNAKKICNLPITIVWCHCKKFGFYNKFSVLQPVCCPGCESRLDVSRLLKKACKKRNVSSSFPSPNLHCSSARNPIWVHLLHFAAPPSLNHSPANKIPASLTGTASTICDPQLKVIDASRPLSLLPILSIFTVAARSPILAVLLHSVAPASLIQSPAKEIRASLKRKSSTTGAP